MKFRSAHQDCKAEEIAVKSLSQGLIPKDSQRSQSFPRIPKDHSV